MRLAVLEKSANVIRSVGHGCMHQVNDLSLEFQIYRPLDQATARKLLVECVDEFLAVTNTDRDIRPYLKKCPFTTAEARIVMFSVSKEAGHYWDPYISVVSNFTHLNPDCTVALYRTESPDKAYGYQAEYEEDYAEAVKIVRRDAGQ